MRQKETGSDLAVDALDQCGIKAVFANPGTTEMHMVGSLLKRQGIHCVLGLHESVCTGAADAYARMTRQPAACLLHLGPGLANGLCGLHNAKRACSPVLVLVGEMATWHQEADAFLQSDIGALAGTVGSLTRCTSMSSVYCDVAEAHRSIASSSGHRGFNSRVHTVIMPHDVARAPVDATPSRGERPEPTLPEVQVPRLFEAKTLEFLESCAAAMLARRPGKVCLMLGGDALLSEPGLLELAGRIAAATGAVLMSEAMVSRADRGEGLPRVRRLPYFPKDAQATLAKFSMLVLAGAKPPVAAFGYEDGPRKLVDEATCEVWELDVAGDTLAMALGTLGCAVGAERVVPGKTCRGVFQMGAAERPQPVGPLNPARLCECVAACQEEGDIVVEEAITTATRYWDLSSGAPKHTYLGLTGGAIGSGPTLAVGAAVACPGRRVINFQADGSMCYSLPALWTQAREKLNVVTVICANKAYQILNVEFQMQRVPGSTIDLKAMTSLTDPEISFVEVARGLGVPGGRAETCEAFFTLMEESRKVEGPFLIEAII